MPDEEKQLPPVPKVEPPKPNDGKGPTKAEFDEFLKRLKDKPEAKKE